MRPRKRWRWRACPHACHTHRPRPMPPPRDRRPRKATPVCAALPTGTAARKQERRRPKRRAGGCRQRVCSSAATWGTLSPGAQAPHSFFDIFLNFFHFGRIFVRLPRPEEAPQPVPLAARDDVHVQMWNALADAIVDGHKGAFRLKRLLDRPREQLRIREERLNQYGRKARERFAMLFGHQKRVAWKDGAVIEKRHRGFVFENQRRRKRAGDDLAEGTSPGRPSHGPSPSRL